MRRFLAGFVVAAVAAVTPTLAMGGNQEVAEQIANRFRNSGQMSDYKIGVKYQDGKAWLRGRVANQDQLKIAQELVFQTASVDQIDISGLAVAPSDAVAVESKPAGNPLREQESPLRDQNVMQTSGSQAQGQPSWGKRIEAALFHRGETDVKQTQVASADAQMSLEPAVSEEPRELPRQLNTAPRPTSVSGRNAVRAPARVAMNQATQTSQRVPVMANGAPLPMSAGAQQPSVNPARYDQPCMPNYAWPSYAAYPNNAAVCYPKQYSAQAWPYIGPFYPYPQVPMGWRKVTLQWDSGWWYLDFKDQPASCWHR